MNADKPVVLLISPVLPFPTGSGRALRSWDWLRTLSKDYRVHVLALDGGEEKWPIPSDYPAERVWLSANGKPSGSSFSRAIGGLLPFLTPWFHNLMIDWLDLPPSDATLHELQECLAEESVCRIVVFRLYMHNLGLAARSRFPEALMHLDLDDYESSTRFSVAAAFVRMKRYRRAVSEFVAAIQYRFVERYMPGPYQVAYLAAEADCHSLRTRLASSLAYRPNRVDVPKNFPRASSADVLTLLFVGELSYAPNEEAVQFIVTNLVPELETTLTKPWTICVVGRHASAELSRLMERSLHVESIGDACSVEKWYEIAHMVLVPLRYGGGTKLKALEAFAHHRPVVSTSHGMRGLGASAGEHFLLAETAAAFAREIGRLADDRSLADRIAEAGWQLYCERYRIE